MLFLELRKLLFCSKLSVLHNNPSEYFLEHKLQNTQTRHSQERSKRLHNYENNCLKPHYIVALCLISGHTSPKRSPKNMPILAPPKNCNFLSAIPVSAAQDCVQCLTTLCKLHCTALHYGRSRLGRICGEGIATKHNQFTLFVCA